MFKSGQDRKATDNVSSRGSSSAAIFLSDKSLNGPCWIIEVNLVIDLKARMPSGTDEELPERMA
jgi:hypothetical protein